MPDFGDYMVRFITIEREYGSQGAEFARTLADRLGWELLDAGLIDAVAKKAKVPTDVAQAYDERIDPWYFRYGRAFWYSSVDRLSSSEEARFDSERFVELLRETMRDAADRGNRPQAQGGCAGGQKRSPRGARARRLTAPARAEKSSSGIGGHPFPRDRCAASLALAPALFQALDSAHQTISGSAQ